MSGYLTPWQRRFLAEGSGERTLILPRRTPEPMPKLSTPAPEPSDPGAKPRLSELAAQSRASRVSALSLAKGGSHE